MQNILISGQENASPQEEPTQIHRNQAEPTTAQLSRFMGQEQTVEEEGNEGIAKLKNPPIIE